MATTPKKRRSAQEEFDKLIKLESNLHNIERYTMDFGSDNRLMGKVACQSFDEMKQDLTEYLSYRRKALMDEMYVQVEMKDITKGGQNG